MKNTFSTVRQWLISDQYDHGEFGKHETEDQTNISRTLEKSMIKPNIFSSITAYCTLLTTGVIPNNVVDSFHQWLDIIRSDTGYWTSASGKTMPFPNATNWAKSNNLRHTAKCLDYYLLNNMFGYEDATLFNNIIDCQLDNGSFPQFKGMNSDLWSTAYFANLLIRASMQMNLNITCPRRINHISWKNNLNNRLRRAIDWLLHELDSNSMWSIQGADKVIVTLAMMVEIGGYLAIHEKETCSAIISSLLERAPISATLVYVSCIAMDSLPSSKQALVYNYYKTIIDKEEMSPTDLIDAVSLCKLLFVDNDIGLILYYRDICNGHESLLCSASPWNKNEYLKWLLDSTYENNYKANMNPIHKADFWQFVNDTILKIKSNIEYSRGWQFLWEGELPVTEDLIQVYLNQQLSDLCNNKIVSVNREQETGRGPVDFTFTNCYADKIILEVKKDNNKALKNGDFLAQIYEYAKGIKVSAAFLVIVGFSSGSASIMDNIKTIISSFKHLHNDFYVQVIYIDASKKLVLQTVN